METKEYKIDGYKFNSEAEYNLAKSDLVKIKRLVKEMEDKKTEDILKIYNMVIKKNILKTQIGYNFLYGIRKKLLKNPSVSEEEIMLIDIRVSSEVQKDKKENLKLLERNDEIKDKFKCSLFVNLVLIIVIIVMFVISYNSKKFDETAYEQSIQDRYSSWEAALESKEADLEKIINNTK